MRTGKHCAGARMAAGLLACVLAASAAAQNPNLRPPTDEERAVLFHYRDAVHQVIDQEVGDDWQEDPGQHFDIDDHVAVHKAPDRPLDIDEMISREYRIRTGSKLYQEQLAPIIEMAKNASDPANMARIAKERKSTHYIVMAHFNVLAAGVDPPPGMNAPLNVPGAALAYRVKADSALDESVVLLFGDWKSATWKAGDGVYRYHFKKPGMYTAVENIVIELKGAPPRVEELLRTLDWQKMNEGLAPAKP